MKRWAFIAVAVVVCAALYVPRANASTLNPILTRDGHAWNDSLDWAQLGDCESVLSNPLNPPPVSLKGLVVNTTLKGGPVLPTEQMTPDFLGGCPENLLWPGNFNPGDALIYTSLAIGGPLGGFGPITLDFDRPIQGIGTQFEGGLFFEPFTAQIDAFGDAGFIGSVSTTGFSDITADNTAVFLGLVDPTGANITRVVLSVFIDVPEDEGIRSLFLIDGDFAINQLSLDVPQETEPPVNPVPEPASLVLVGGGLVTLALHVRRRSA